MDNNNKTALDRQNKLLRKQILQNKLKSAKFLIRKLTQDMKLNILSFEVNKRFGIKYFFTFKFDLVNCCQ